MKIMRTSLVILASLGLAASAASQSVFVSEIHYDNSGGDQGAFALDASLLVVVL